MNLSNLTTVIMDEGLRSLERINLNANTGIQSIRLPSMDGA
jgi:hypothetical protein